MVCSLFFFSVPFASFCSSFAILAFFCFSVFILLLSCFYFCHFFVFFRYLETFLLFCFYFAIFLFLFLSLFRFFVTWKLFCFCNLFFHSYLTGHRSYAVLITLCRLRLLPQCCKCHICHFCFAMPLINEVRSYRLTLHRDVRMPMHRQKYYNL